MDWKTGPSRPIGRIERDEDGRYFGVFEALPVPGHPQGCLCGWCEETVGPLPGGGTVTEGSRELRRTPLTLSTSGVTRPAP